MVVYAEEMALHTGEETDWTAATTGATYSPKADGKLLQIKLFFGQTSAASVVTVASARLQCPLWGLDAQVSLQASGIQTAPAFPNHVGVQNVDLPVKTGVPITIAFKHLTGAITPVTSNLKLVGVFEA